MKMDLALNNLQWLLCHKIQPTNRGRHGNNGHETVLYILQSSRTGAISSDAGHSFGGCIPLKRWGRRIRQPLQTGQESFKWNPFQRLPVFSSRVL